MSKSVAGQALVLLGINHNTAPLDVRERLAIPSSQLADATRALAHQPGIREALILSTCNRVELLTVQETAEDETIRQPGMLSFLTNTSTFRPPRSGRMSTSFASARRCGTCFASPVHLIRWSWARRRSWAR